MPETMQVGLVSYSDWTKANDFDPFTHNSTVLIPGGVAGDPTPSESFNPDITARFEYARYATPDAPPAFAGADLTEFLRRAVNSIGSFGMEAAARSSGRRGRETRAERAKYPYGRVTTTVLLPAVLPVLRITNTLKDATSPGANSPSVVRSSSVPAIVVPETVALSESYVPPIEKRME